MTTIALDYGRRHVGLALAEPGSSLAVPLESIHVTTTTQLVPQVLARLLPLKPERIVVGLPEGELEAEVKAFARLLTQAGYDILLHPETLSSQEAVAHLRQGKAKRRKLEQEHSYAACLILEDFLEMESNWPAKS